ncbi:hypothetical protein M2408_003532 [Sphingobacterium sp. BIGb0165]|nr:hypothetical protein [Sphingobacterium sp. BIGb0165]
MFEGRLNPHFVLLDSFNKKIYLISSLCCDFTIFVERLSYYMLEEVMYMWRLQ